MTTPMPAHHNDVTGITPTSDVITTTVYVHSIPNYVRATVVTIVTTLIVVSNIVNLYCLPKMRDFPANSRLFLQNLSVADLSIGLATCLPAVYASIHDVWPYGQFYCQLSGLAHGVSVCVSIWSLASVSVDR